jgi:hypothetical protein
VPGDVGVDTGFSNDAGLAGGEGFDFGVGDGLFADVVDLPFFEAAVGDLADERGVGFEGLPPVGVEAAFGDAA